MLVCCWAVAFMVKYFMAAFDALKYWASFEVQSTGESALKTPRNNKKHDKTLRQKEGNNLKSFWTALISIYFIVMFWKNLIIILNYWTTHNFLAFCLVSRLPCTQTPTQKGKSRQCCWKVILRTDETETRAHHLWKHTENNLQIKRNSYPKKQQRTTQFKREIVTLRSW